MNFNDKPNENIGEELADSHVLLSTKSYLKYITQLGCKQRSILPLC